MSVLRTTLSCSVALAVAGVAVDLAPGLTRVPALRRHLPALNGDGNAGHVALTFDDGPDPGSTPAFLDELDRVGVRATFFVLGRMVHRAPGLARELVERGHEVGVHGWDHTSLALRGPAATVRDLVEATTLVEDVTGRTPRWWRPPYGVLTTAGVLAAGSAGLRPVLWSSWGQDWTSRATPASVLETVLSGLSPGGTVLLHDSSCTSASGAWHSALGALPPLVRHCHERGLSLGPLGEHGLDPR